MRTRSLLTHVGRPYTAARALAWGSAIGALGGLIGLGGAEFRLPVLVSRFGLKSLDAVVMNKAVSLVVVSSALLFRFRAIPATETLARADVVLNLLAGSLVGSWFAAGYAVRIAGPKLNRLIVVLLLSLAAVMLAEGFLGVHGEGRPLFASPVLQIGAGMIAGLVIGAVAALLGVAGGELLIPTIVLLYGVDIRLAGSLSLAVSLPTMIVGLARYRTAGAFAVLEREKSLLTWMALGSIGGAAIGGLLLGIASARAITMLLAVILAISAVKVFEQAKPVQSGSSQAKTRTRFTYNESMSARRDKPRDAFGLLSWPVNAVLIGALGTVSAVAWGVTIRHADSMGAMVMGLGQIGFRAHGTMGVVEFLSMWIAMMAAMMLPTIVPMVLSHHAGALRRREGVLSTPVFVTGYMLVWTAVALVVWPIYQVIARWGGGEAHSPWLPTLAGAVFFFAGLYQFTRLKRRCADMCRSPLTFVFIHRSSRGLVDTFRTGVMHGVYCLGCCWAEMMVLVVVGLTNLPAMALLFLLFLVEKNWKHGRAVANVAGIGMMILGVAVFAFPSLLVFIST